MSFKLACPSSRINQNLQQVTPSCAKAVKHCSTSSARSKASIKWVRNGFANSATKRMSSMLTMKKFQNQMPSITSLRQLLKSWIKLAKIKIFLWFFVWISQAQCASLNQLKAILTSRETRKEISTKRWWSSQMVRTSSSKGNEVWPMSQDCNASNRLSPINSSTWLTVQETGEWVSSPSTTKSL